MGVGPGTIGTWDHAFICICWSWDRPGTEVSWGPNGKEQMKQESKRKKVSVETAQPQSPNQWVGWTYSGKKTGGGQKL